MDINPQILTWARETAGMSIEDAVQALGFGDTRRRTAAERLQALESGAEQPTSSLLQKMAEKYRRSLLVFYLSEPPPTGDRGKDFRTVPGAPPPLFNPLLDALIRDIRKRQEIVRHVQEEVEAPHVDFVGAASLSDPVEALTRRVTERLPILP
jgi:transcriptional regulator with XRE-family HTH domain